MSPPLLSLLLIGSLLFVSSHAQEPHFVLVHGNGGGAWCWYKIIARLEAAGYNATALDLKGAGTDLTDPETVHTFEDYNEPLINFLEKLPHDQKVILVGHSAGGLSVTYASYKFSEKIQVAIYVAATMLEHGYEEDTKNDSLHRQNIQPKIKRGRNLHATEECLDPGFRQIISQEDAALRKILDRFLPREVLSSARFEGTGAESVKRIYIKTLYDEKISPKSQDDMIQKWPPAKVFEVESGHDIIKLHPSKLSNLLINIASSSERK